MASKINCDKMPISSVLALSHWKCFYKLHSLNCFTSRLHGVHYIANGREGGGTSLDYTHKCFHSLLVLCACLASTTTWLLDK